MLWTYHSLEYNLSVCIPSGIYDSWTVDQVDTSHQSYIPPHLSVQISYHSRQYIRMYTTLYRIKRMSHLIYAPPIPKQYRVLSIRDRETKTVLYVTIKHSPNSTILRQMFETRNLKRALKENGNFYLRQFAQNIQMYMYMYMYSYQPMFHVANSRHGTGQ